MNFNLILALFWLILALASCVYYLVRPEGGVWILGRNVSLTWVAGFAVFMFAYNIVRWLLSRAKTREREALRRAPRKRHQPEEWNPELDFSDEKDKGK